LVIATGGLTVPKIGATPFGYRLAEQFGLPVVAPRPALVPLAFAPDDLARYGDLAGVSTEVAVACGEGHFRESLLFTHRGLSGPAILQISSYWNGRAPLAIDLAPADDVAEWLLRRGGSSARLDTVLAERLPKRLARQWCAHHGVTVPMNALDEAKLRTIAAQLRRWEVLPSGTLGYNKAEVTLGGVDTRGLSPSTMETNTVSGLYFIGEVVDVTGWLGGYNFQWAWASAHAAGQVA
jgi:predicted Rossmann fold flavoprotein